MVENHFEYGKICNGITVWRLVTSWKGGDAMVTYEGLFAYSIVIIEIITLCWLIFFKK